MINFADQSIEIQPGIRGKIKENPTAPYFTLVRTYPLPYEFYSFNYQGKSYWAPVEHYQNLGLIQGQVYSEKRILKLLKRETCATTKMDARLQRFKGKNAIQKIEQYLNTLNAKYETKKLKK